jgi:hypothetical protein
MKSSSGTANDLAPEALDEVYPVSEYHPDVLASEAESASGSPLKRGPRPDSVRRKLRMSVSEILADCKLEPIGAIVDLIHDPDTPKNTKADLLKFMATFLHAKKAAPPVKETNPGVKLNLNLGRK